eukprot:Platyproteum_vivax@DN5551_c0_g1_i1.p1
MMASPSDTPPKTKCLTIPGSPSSPPEKDKPPDSPPPTIVLPPTDKQLHLMTELLSKEEELHKFTKQIFQVFDDNRDNKLDVLEMIQVLKHLRVVVGLPPLDKKYAKSLLRKYDYSGDQNLDEDEVVLMFRSLFTRLRNKFVKIPIDRSAFIGRKIGKIDDFYKKGEKRGEGSFGIVCACTHIKSGQPRVCKIIPKGKAGMSIEEIIAEMEILLSLDHPNILRAFDYYEDYANIYLITEEARGGELFEVIQSTYKNGGKLTEAWIAHVMRQVLDSIIYAHQCRLMHKDLKPQNVLLDGEGDHPHVVVIDWGLAEMMSSPDGRSHKAAGTPHYMAPEVYKQNFGCKCDVWSCGVIMFQLLSGKVPFSGSTIKALMESIISKPIPWDMLGNVSPEVTDLLKQMMVHDEAKRLSPIKCLEHPWFKLAPRLVEPLDPTCVEGLRKFSQKSSMQKAVVTGIASQMNVNQLRNINATFKLFDKDGGGSLDVEELDKALSSLGFDAATRKSTIEAMDANYSGEVTYTEFLSATISMTQDLLSEHLWAIFQQFDADNSGSITAEELQQVLGSKDGHGLLPGGKTAEQVLSEIDKDGNGTIEFMELKNYLLLEIDPAQKPRK